MIQKEILQIMANLTNLLLITQMTSRRMMPNGRKLQKRLKVLARKIQCPGVPRMKTAKILTSDWSRLSDRMFGVCVSFLNCLRLLLFGSGGWVRVFLEILYQNMFYLCILWLTRGIESEYVMSWL